MIFCRNIVSSLGMNFAEMNINHDSSLQYLLIPHGTAPGFPEPRHE